MTKLYIFDMNGTLTNTPFVDKVPLAILPGRAEKLAELAATGAKLAIASNQGGVAFGFTTEQEATAEVAAIAGELNMHGFRVAFGHPSPKRGYEEYAAQEHLEKRKPAPGMLISLMKEFRVSASETMMIGDREEDRDAATAAHCQFMWTKDFFANLGELVATLYNLFHQAAHLMNERMVLRLSSENTGALEWENGEMIYWATLQQAPGAITAAIQRHQEEKARAEAVATVPDDFDPFLDNDDLP